MLKLYRNLMLTMIIGGLWHGAAWTFVLWGTYQGVILVGHRLLRPWLDRIHPTEPIDRACWKARADRGDVPHGLLRLAALPGASRWRRSAGMLQAIVYRPAIPAAAYLLPVARRRSCRSCSCQVVQYVTQGPRRHRADALVRPERLLHGLLLRLRARRASSAAASSSTSSSETSRAPGHECDALPDPDEGPRSSGSRPERS